MGEFFRVGNDAHRLNLPLLYIDSQDGEHVLTRGSKHCRMAVDYNVLPLIARRPEAPRAHAETCRRVTPANRTQRSLFDFPARIRPQNHILGEQAYQGLHLASLNCLGIAVEQLLMHFARGREAWPVLPEVLFRPAKRAAAGGFALLKHGRDLSKLVLEDFAQQEDRSLERLKLLQQDQEGQRDRLLRVDALFRVASFSSLRCEDRLRQPGTNVLFSLPARELKLIHS